MTTSELMELLEDFIETTKYNSVMAERFGRLNKNHIVINYSDLLNYNPDLVTFFLSEPEDFLEAFKLTIQKRFNINYKLTVRIFGLQQVTNVGINQVRASKHLNKFITVTGTISAKSPIKTMYESIKFECPSCGGILNVLQYTGKIREPSQCGCGRKTKFKRIDSKTVDMVSIILEELAEKSQDELRRIHILVKRDLLDKHIDEKLIRGKTISISGILMGVSNSTRNELDILLDANYIDFISEDFETIDKITESDEKKIKEISKHKDLVTFLSEQIYYSVHGNNEIKKALVLQLVGGLRVVNENISTRGDIHILLIGDPGVAKSNLLKATHSIAPISRYAIGSGLSYAGLLAGVDDDILLGGKTIRAGAIVLAHKGILAIDEFDKIDEDSKKGLHEALEQQQVTVDKIVKGTFNCQTSILAAANPKFGRFDPYNDFYKQVNLSPTIVSRMDLRFPIKDTKDEDKLIGTKIVNRYITNGNQIKERIDSGLIKKYIIYAKQFNPKITPELAIFVRDKWIELRNKEQDVGALVDRRTVIGAMRLATASARLHLRDVITADVELAYELILKSVMAMCQDQEGNCDLNRITTGIGTTTKNKIAYLIETISNLDFEKGVVKISEILQKAMDDKMIKNLTEGEELLNKLKLSGDLYEPRNGLIRLINGIQR